MTEFAFSDIIDWDSLDEAGRTEILRRPAVMAGERISAVVKDILDNVEKNGDQALREYSAKFDRTEVKNFRISKEEVDAAWERVSPDFRAALQRAARNIEKFHTAEKLEPVVVETMPGVRCEQVTRPIEAVGLYRGKTCVICSP
ncbi:MAG: histidinol dehydrogenase [Sutterella wadsworthensis]|nr:histidinol dehydrogenase [Sutterella wadsworthensis]